MRDGLAGEQADAGVVSAFGEVVADLELVFASAELACRARGEVIRKREENLGAEGLKQRAPALPGQRGFAAN